MNKKNIIITSLAIISLLAVNVYAQVQTPALIIGSISKSQSITSLSYQVTVPTYSNINTTSAFEFHAGMIDGQNTTFIKSTISHGCPISAHKGCDYPFTNRYLFYISIIDISSKYRTQYPSNGYVITSGSNYTITFTKTHCIFGIQAWSFSISNLTKSFSTKICMLNQNFIYPVSGMLEMHNVTDCEIQLPSSHIFTQSNYLINSQPINNSTWSLIEVNPYINCNFTNTYSGDNIIVGWG